MRSARSVSTTEWADLFVPLRAAGESSLHAVRASAASTRAVLMQKLCEPIGDVAHEVRVGGRKEAALAVDQLQHAEQATFVRDRAKQQVFGLEVRATVALWIVIRRFGHVRDD